MTGVYAPDADMARVAVVRAAADAAGWDAFVRAAPDACVTHLAAWHRVMRDALGHETLAFAAMDHRDAYAGVLPLVRVRSRVFGHYLVSMPFLNSGGPAGTGAARGALARAAYGEAVRSGATLLELRTRQACGVETDVPAERAPRSQAPGTRGSLTTSHRKISVRLPMPDTADALWARFPAKLRSQIRRPMKDGLTVRFGVEQRHAFHDVYVRHMRDLGSPAHGARVFDAIAQHLAEHVWFAAVYHGAEPVAAGCGFVWRDEFELVWAASLRHAQRMAPNMLLYWALMQHAIAHGVRAFDFGRCSPGSGTHKFKQQWGGADVALPWAQWSAHGATSPPVPDQPRYRAAVALWQRLPLRVTRVCGPSLARLIP